MEPASEETTESTATPEASAEPEATPEGSTQPQATAEATTEPENSPEASIQPTAAAEASAQPEAVQESGAPQESTAPESTVSPAPGEEGKHIHTEACYEMRLVCGLEEHTHTDECYKEAYCGIPAHVHMPGCYDEEGNVICGKEEHIHEGNCYKEPHCGITAHTHTEECCDENGELICGLEEHTHGDECFVEEDTYTGPFHCQERIQQHTADCYDEENNLICGLADYVVHTHTEACYDEDGQLICPLPEIEEHAHSAQCYDIPGEGEEAQLNCGKEEAKLHTHTEECYDEEGNLTCGMLQVEEHVHSEACLTETEEAHTHTEDCYDEEGKLICGFEEAEEELPFYCAEYVHKHSEECYDENQNLICGKVDFVAHVHTEDCYNKAGELVCPLPEIEAHTHSAACYGEANGQLEAELICGKTEDIKLHTHTEECYDADGKLICGKLEVLEHVHSDACHVKPEAVEEITYYCQEMVHEHSEDCYNENGELICGEADYVVHTHTEKCYGADGKLICPLPEIEVHAHTEECYDENGQLICGKEEAQLHTHTEECYDENGALICGQTEVLEHIHSKECEVSHKPVTKTFQSENFVVTATYKPDANIPEEAELIAEQITAESNEEHYAKRQAEYQEALGDDKATMRALLKIGFYVNGEEVEPESAVSITVQFLDENGLAEGKPITVIHFADEGTELLEGSKVEDGSTTFEMNSFSEIAVGYGVENVKIPVDAELKYETDELEVTFHIEGEVNVPFSPDSEKGREETYPYDSSGTEAEEGVSEGDSVEDGSEAGTDTDASTDDAEGETIVDSPKEESKIAEGGVSVEIQNDNIEKKLEFRVDPLKEDSEEYAEAEKLYSDGTEETIEENDDLLFLEVLSYGMIYDGKNLDLTDCIVTAEIIPSEALVEYAETAVTPMTLELDGQETTQNAEFTPEVTITIAGEDVLDGFAVNQESRIVPKSVTLGNNGIAAFSGTSQANPKFTVQYYANIDVFDNQSGEDRDKLEIIDTKGKNLPYNNEQKSAALCNDIFMNRSDNKIAKKQELREVYRAKEYEYITAPGLVYFNRLAENGNYDLNQIWVLKEGETDSQNVDKNKWDIYPCKIKENGVEKKVEWHFTNKSETAEKYKDFIQIKEGAVIRLVCNVTTESIPNDAKFYDYDISDGNLYKTTSNSKDSDNVILRTDKVHNSNDTWYMYTGAQGINSYENTFAFGNSEGSVKTGKGGNEWIDKNGLKNKLNMANPYGYGGCTFGLASKLENNEIVYAPGVNPPVLFDDDDRIGKSSYSGQLTFSRSGDTYTLIGASVNGVKTLDNLDSFSNRLNYGKDRTLWSNKFWPMDKVPSAGTNGHDLMFGKKDKCAKLKNFGKNGDTDTKSAPEDDYDTNHNSYFGMRYEVGFKLTEDYIGPLEYIFYGDDDMWVFLSQDGGKTGELICDIGGVHGAVGEYVDLWDYIGKGSSGEYSLHFFYTERGASGSTCWMQFTLPSVSFKTTEQTTGNLEITKKVTDGVNDDLFGFEIKFTDESGISLRNNYSYTQYDANGRKIKDDILIWDGGKFQLKAGERIEIIYLPIGTHYTITEIGPIEYTEETVKDEDGKDVVIRTVEYDDNGNYKHKKSDDWYIASASGSNTSNEQSAGNSQNQDDKRIARGTIITATQKYSVNYVNKYVPTYVLPETGGSGTIPYTVAGTTIVLLGGAGLMYRKKFRERRG